MFLSPLEQFEVVNILSLNLFFIDLALTNSTLVTFIILFLIYIFFYFCNKVSNFALFMLYTHIQNLLEFVRSLIWENIGKKYIKFFFIICFLFMFLLFANILGMVTYSFTITSQLIVTFFLSFIFFFGVTFLGFQIHGLEFFGLFLPGGAPVFIMPFLILIELISYIARVFSLSIRLFANMMAGHTLLTILASFSWIMLSMFGFWFNVSIILTTVIFIVTGLEFAIAFLQAYVFSVLVCIYLNDAINLH